VVDDPLALEVPEQGVEAPVVVSAELREKAKGREVEGELGETSAAAVLQGAQEAFVIAPAVLLVGRGDGKRYSLGEGDAAGGLGFEGALVNEDPEFGALGFEGHLHHQVALDGGLAGEDHAVLDLLRGELVAGLASRSPEGDQDLALAAGSLSAAGGVYRHSGGVRDLEDRLPGLGLQAGAVGLEDDDMAAP
jgi:hypothetical protein